MPDRPGSPARRRPPAKTVSTWLSVADYRALQAAAEARAVSLSALVRSLLTFRPPDKSSRN